jgi:hypothetical protein
MCAPSTSSLGRLRVDDHGAGAVDRHVPKRPAVVAVPQVYDVAGNLNADVHRHSIGRRFYAGYAETEFRRLECYALRRAID